MKNVTKRNGDVVPLDIHKIKKVVASACEGLPCDPNELEMDAQVLFQNKILTREIQKMLIQTAVEKISEDNPDWQYVAARLLLCDINKDALVRRNRKNEPYGGFYEMIQEATAKGLYSERILESYSEEDIQELEKYIKPERDYLFNYAGLKTLKDRYMLIDHDRTLLELPQECFMGVAMFLAIPENDRVKWAKEFYDIMSKLEVMAATPTLSNARKPHSQLSSCFIGTIDDSLDSIMDNVNTFAQLSKYGGGVGMDITTVRAQGSEIRGFPNCSGGTVPWIRILNDTAVAVDQLGVRKGALTIHMGIWHQDIMDFMDLKTNSGDDRRKAHDIFPQIGITDNFMQAVLAREEFAVFDPYMVRKHLGYEISDFYGDEFTAKYNDVLACEAIPKTYYPAVELFKKILKSAFETGLPYVFFRDTTNLQNPNKHKGVVRSSNLCQEIAQNMSPTQFEGHELSEDGEITFKRRAGDLVVCNLSSVNLFRVSEFEDLERVIPIQVRMLDNVIDLNYYPVPEAEFTNHRYRAIGLGTMGYHAYLAKKGLVWESDAHLQEVDKLYEKIAYETIKASSDLAKEKGRYSYFQGSDWDTGDWFGGRDLGDNLDWDGLKAKVKKDGLRNGYLLATAPTGSISILAGTTAGIDPVFAKVERTEKKDGLVVSAVPELNDATYWIYKAAHLIDQNWVVRAGSVRQKWIDQSQSLNLFVHPKLSAKELASYYINAWKLGCKTIYYMRSKAVELDEACESCAG